jgi:hypothetical protein
VTEMQNRGSSTARRKTWLIPFRGAQLANEASSLLL